MTSSERRRTTRLSRRSVLTAVGTGVLGGWAGFTEGILPDGPDSSGGDGAGGTDPWSQEAELTPDDDRPTNFGYSVALACETALVSVGRVSVFDGEVAGAAYVFERPDGEWRQQAKVVPDDGDPIDLFGASVAISDDATTALIGARVDGDPNGRQAGSAYVFEQTNGTWSQRIKLAPDKGSHVFGRSVALSGETALIGTADGTAYVF